MSRANTCPVNRSFIGVIEQFRFRLDMSQLDNMLLEFVVERITYVGEADEYPVQLCCSAQTIQEPGDHEYDHTVLPVAANY